MAANLDYQHSVHVAPKPLRLLAALPFFLVPGALLFAGVHFLMPALNSWGVELAFSYMLAFAIPLSILLIAALIAYHLEGRRWTWQELSVRYRLLPLNRTDWWWILAALIAEGAGAFLFHRVDTWFVDTQLIPYPDVAVLSDRALEQIAGGGGAIVVSIVAVLLLNVLAEELWFRGYLLPRQIAAYGSLAWIANWLPWWFFAHAFKWWGLMTILPTTAVTVYLAHKTGKLQRL